MRSSKSRNYDWKREKFNGNFPWVLRTIREEHKVFSGKRVFSTSTAILLAVAIATLGWSGMAAAEEEEAGQELQNNFSNANVTVAGNALVNITSPFERTKTCAMIYVFDTSQAMEECCGCPLTADGLLTISITNDLAAFPVGDATAGINSLSDGSIRILSTVATFPPSTWTLSGDTIPPYVGCDTANSICCDPTGSYNGRGGLDDSTLTPGNELVAWGQHIQTTQTTETEFEVASRPLVSGAIEAGTDSDNVLDPDFDGLPQACSGITTSGSGAGVCICPTEGPTS